MPRKSPYLIKLSPEERRELEARARKYTSPYREVVRAKIVLLAAQGLSNDRIAARLDLPRQIVSKWRKRFYENGFPGLDEQPRGGLPPAFPPSLVVPVKALACKLPHRLGLPLSWLSISETRQHVITQGLVAEISGARLAGGAGSAAMPCARGNIGAGSFRAILTLLPRPVASLTSMSASGRASLGRR
jgi:hypothetical protein